MTRWRQAGLLRRVETLAAVVVLLVVAVLGVAISAATDARSAIDKRGNRLGPANTAVVELLAEYTDEETGVRGYIVTQDPSFLSPYRRAQERLDGQYARIETLLRSEPALVDRLRQVRIDHDAWVRNVAEPEIEASRRGDFGRAADIERSGQGRVRFDIVRSGLEELQQGIAEARDRESRRISGAQDVLLATLVAAIVLVLALTAAGTLAVSRGLIRPFTRVKDAVEAVASGKLDTRVPSSGPQEVADLGTSVEKMRSRLVSSLDESRRAVEALTQQGPAVIALRDALAPSRSTSRHLAVAGRLDPAEGVLAGDWYDALDLPGGRVGLLVGDVSGHGPGPGVFALRLKHLLAAALATGMTPGQSVEWVVGQLGDTGEMFASALVLVLDPLTGRIDYTNAGHPEGVVVRRTGSQLQRLLPTGPILSPLLLGSGAWKTRETSLEVGDVLFVYTDGLVEARGGDGRELGTAGLFDHLQLRTGASRPEGPQALLDDVFAFVEQYSGGRVSDDRTALAVARAESAAAPPSTGAIRRQTVPGSEQATRAPR